MKNSLSAKCSLWGGRVISLVVLALVFCLSRILDWYQQLRPLPGSSRMAIIIGFYCCVPVVLYALYSMEKLLKNILSESVFVQGNIRFLRRIRWCCAVVGLICLVAGLRYPPLLFLAVMMGFLSRVVSVVKNVMAAAVEIREENDLPVCGGLWRSL